MVGRNENGQFTKGYKGGPGRPKKEREVRYYEILQTAVTFDDWKQIVDKAVQDAKRGDAVARKWLADYLIGAPIQKSEVSGVDGSNLQIEVIYTKANDNA